MQAIYWAAILVAVSTALGRSLGIFAVKFRQLAYRKRAVRYPSTWRDRIASPEPFVLFGLTLGLLATHTGPATLTVVQLLITTAGAVAAGSGIALMLWAVRSFPTVSSGHYILPEHSIVTKGPYSWVRHPLYLAGLLIWIGLLVTFGSALALAIALLYVLPAYWIYMRAEERMMLEHFGDAYRQYKHEVGMLIPRWRGQRADIR
jgi:protein-S-isoprenylcysteine O-methyltransferase Ste14